MADSPIRTNSRTFQSIKQDLLNYVETNYPEYVNAFRDSNDLGSLLLDTQAGIADALNFQIDLAFRNNQLAFASRRNLFEIAKNIGLKLRGRASSLTIVDISVEVPVDPSGDKPDFSYLPTIRAGTQFTGGGTTFEVSEDIDFKSDLTNGNDATYSYQRIDNGASPATYLVNKKEIVYAGRTKQFKKTFQTPSDFQEIVLPDRDVINIEQLIIKPGLQTEPRVPNSEFFNSDFRWYEVDYLGQPEIFVGETDSNGQYIGNWVEVDKKFITEFTPNGFLRITFGNGFGAVTNFKVSEAESPLTARLYSLIKNNSLGQAIPPNSTVYVRYRIGGGRESNVAANTIRSVGFSEITVNGSNPSINQSVINSLTVNNPIGAIGGADFLSDDEIRYLIQYNLASRYGALTFGDYVLKVKQLNGRFGVPYKVSAYEENNKVSLYILGLNNDGTLNANVSDLLTLNIKNYLSRFRMINDFVQVKTAKIVNIGFMIEVLAEQNSNETDIVNGIRSILQTELSNTKLEINQNVYLGNIIKQINDIASVNNLVDLVAYNFFDPTGEIYSPFETTMELSSEIQLTRNEESYSRGTIRLVKNTLFTNFDEILEIKNFSTDVNIVINRQI